MSGMRLGSGIGLNGSVIGGLYGGYGNAAVPAATSVPEGPSTITQAAYGVPGAGGGGGKGLTVAAIGTGALVALAFIWWSLPR